MDSAMPEHERRKLAAHIVPMGVFLGALALVSLLKRIGGAFWLDAPEYWIYPVQTIACAAVLWWWWRDYDLRTPRGLLVTLAVAVVVFVLWISPQAIFGSAPRIDGYNPDAVAGSPMLWWTLLLFRFLRLVLVVPLVEEIFWRGFLLRYFIGERFTTIPFGAFSWLSFAAVTIGFMLVHSTADWPAAAVTGALFNLVAYRTKSLSSCVVAHAVTNLFLGLWIMHTQQWGFW
ncbi:MAG: CAAX prenyl protease-related protein [Chthoniobacterales bacterium]